MKKLLLSLLLVITVLLSGCGDDPIVQVPDPNAPVAECPDAPDGNHVDANDDETCDICSETVVFVIDFYALNDVHGKFSDNISQPGLDEMTTYLKGANDRDDYSVILSSGDMWQGSGESNLTHGLIMTDWMNQMGFASMTMGNHEFDWGEGRILENKAIAEFPFLAINIMDWETEERVEYCEPSVLIDKGDVQIGIIGAISDCINSISGEHNQDFYFVTGNALTNMIKKEAESLRTQGADVIVLSVHGGFPEYDDRLSQEGVVDIVFEGHDHSEYAKQDQYGVWHLQTGGDNRKGGISHAEIKVNTAKDTAKTNSASILTYNNDYSTSTASPLINTLLDKYSEKIDWAYEPLGKTDHLVESNELRNLCIDLYYEKGMEKWGNQYEIALAGAQLSPRSPGQLAQGDVTYAQLMAVLPFDNHIVLCSMLGYDLREVFLNSMDKYYCHVNQDVINNIEVTKTYYVISDTYKAYFASNNMTIVDTYETEVYARDLVADYIKSGGLNGSTPLPEISKDTVEAGKIYKMYMTQGTLNQRLYFTGSMSGEYLATTQDPAQAAPLYAEAAEGGLYLYFLVDNSKVYVTFYKNSNDKVRPYLTDSTPSFAFVWNDTAKTLTGTLEGGTYCFGTYRDFSTFSASSLSYITGENAGALDTTQFIAHFVFVGNQETGGNTPPDGGDSGTTTPPDGGDSGTTTPPDGGDSGTTPEDYKGPELGVAHHMYMVQATLGKTLYFNGTMSGEYFGTAEDKPSAVSVYVEKDSTGYYLYFNKNSQKNYLTLYKNQSGKVRPLIQTTKPEHPFVWNEDANTFVVSFEGGNYYYGTWNTYATFSATSLHYITGDNTGNMDVTQFVSHFEKVENGSGTTTPPDGGDSGTTTPPDGGDSGTTTPPDGGDSGTTPEDYKGPELGVAHHMYMVQATLGKTLYFNGAMSGEYLGAAEDKSSAVFVYVEKDSTGYYLYFNKNSQKNYLTLYKNQSGKVRPLIQTTKPEHPFVWNEDANTFVVSFEGGNYYYGTWNTYATFSATSLHYITGDNTGNMGVTQFVAQFEQVNNGSGTTTPPDGGGSGGSQPCTQHADANGDKKCDNCQITVVWVLDIYALNDLHGKIFDTNNQPGVDELTTYFKQVQTTDDYVIILSSGDMWQGSTESNLTNGLIMTDWMNEVGFVSMTLGNHEFDWPQDKIYANQNLADFPFLAINIYNRSTNQLMDYCQPSVIVDKGDFQIGIIGAIGNCYSSISGEMSGDFYFKTGSALTALVQAESQRLREAGCDIIVYSVHGGYSEYDIALSQGGYVDVVFEGHEHDAYSQVDEYGVWHLQTNGNNTGLAHVEIEIHMITGATYVTVGELVDNADYSSYGSDPIVSTLSEKYDAEIGWAFETIGTTTYKTGAQLRQLVADLYYHYGNEKWGNQYDIVLGGGYITIRSPGNLYAGDVNFAKLIELFPFDNKIMLCSASGQFLIDYFANDSTKNYFNCYKDGMSKTEFIDSIDPQGTYYFVTDTYTSTYAPYRGLLTEIAAYSETDFARHFLKRYIEDGWQFVPAALKAPKTSPRWESVVMFYIPQESLAYNNMKYYL